MAIAVQTVQNPAYTHTIRSSYKRAILQSRYINVYEKEATMETPNTKYKNLLIAYTAFGASVGYYDFLKHTWPRPNVKHFSYESLLDGAQRSLIEHFNNMIEVLWKYLEWLLDHQFGIKLDVINPHNSIIKAGEMGILTESDVSLLLELIPLGNQTSDIYQDKLSADVAHQLYTAHGQIKEVIEKCNVHYFSK